MIGRAVGSGAGDARQRSPVACLQHSAVVVSRGPVPFRFCVWIVGATLIADTAAAADETVHAVASCATASTSVDGQQAECEATVCVTAEPGHYLDNPSIVTELYLGSGHGCGAPYTAETDGDVVTRICADMHAQSEAGPHGGPGRVRCALYAKQRARP